MCNTITRLASVLVLVISCRPTHAASAAGTAGRFSIDHRARRKKKRMNRCERHARSFCVWISRHAITKTWSITRRSVRLVERPIASRATSSHLMRCSSADTVIVLSARSHPEDITVTIVHFVSIPVMSMTVSQETG
jgi:hypothetical protein